MESRKRKREDSEPRIKYHVQQLSRSFERILKENSREELCEVVRKKLDLDSKTNLELVQIRDGILYDLEDDDDFEAFKAAAHAYSSLDVRVSFSADAIPQNVLNTRGIAILDTSTKSLAPEKGPQDKGAQKQFSMSNSESGNRDLDPDITSNVGDQGVERERSNPVLPSFSEEIASPPKKRRKKVHINSDAVTSEVHSPKKRGKNKGNDLNNQALDSIIVATDEAQEPPRKKRKGDKDTGPAVSESLVDEAHSETPGPSDTTNTQMKKSTTRKGDKEMRTEGDFTKELFANASTSAKATSESEPPSRSLESHNSQADPGASNSDAVRHTYASFLSKPRTASEILANYSGSISKKRPRTDPLAAGHVIKDAVTTTKAKSAVEAEKKTKNIDVDVAKASGTKQPKPKLGKSRLSESWVPVDTEESPLSLSIKDPSETDSSKVPDAAVPPQSLDKSSSAVSRIHPSPKNPKTKNLMSNSKLASPCPICLSRPFHLQFKCPLINSGEDAILDRIVQLEAEGGHEDVISELREWVRKVRQKSTGKDKQETEPSHSKIDKSEHRNSPLPSWAPVVSLQSHPSEVIVESTNEGSESASSGSSEEEDVQSKSSSSSDSSSSSRSRSVSPSTNLEQVDLDALIRGPSLKNATLDLSKLDDDIEELESKSHSEDDSVEGDTDWLEEEEEEQEHRLPKFPKHGAFLRSRSSEEVAGDEEGDSASSVGEKAAIVEGNPQLSDSEEEIEPSSQETTGGNEMLQDPSTIADDHVREQGLTHADPVPYVVQEGRHATPTSLAVPESSPTPPAAPAVNAGKPSEATSIELVKEAPPVTTAKTPSDHNPISEGLSNADTQLTPSRLNAAIPISNMSPFKAVVVPQSPSTVQRMKARTGHLPLNPPDDEIGVKQPVFQSTEKIIRVETKGKGDSVEKFQRRSSRRSTQSISTPKPSAPRSNTGLSSMKSVSVDDAQRQPSLPSTQPMPAAKRSVPRSDTGPSSARSMSADDVSPASQPAVKRRGRPPLTEAVKAERQAMREAQKAARAAEKREKDELKTTGRNDSRRPKNREDESVEKQVPLEEVSVSLLPVVTVATPTPTPQWTSLPPALTPPSTVSLSSPAVDELMSSTESKRQSGAVVSSNHAGAPSRSSPVPARLNGVRSPGSISLTSGSRRHDEEDVEQMVVSPEVVAAKVSGAATLAPLFLPGASEMSQSQAVPGFVAMSMPEATDEEERRASPSGSSSASEGPSTKASTVPHAQAVSKAAFPSLSQLSFDKFKPSFLLTSVFSQRQGTRRSVRSAEVHPESGEEDEEDEDEEDDDSSGTEQESSHVPKDKRAGANMPVKRKSRSRGLLH